MKKIISITLFVFLFGCTTPNERLDEGIRNDNTKEVKEAISKGAIRGSGALCIKKLVPNLYRKPPAFGETL